MSSSAQHQGPVWKMITREMPSRFATGKNRRLASLVLGFIHAGMRVECHLIAGSSMVPKPHDPELWAMMDRMVLWKIDSEAFDPEDDEEPVAGITYRFGSSIGDSVSEVFESEDLAGVIFTSVETAPSLWKHIPAGVKRILECDELESSRSVEFSVIENSKFSDFEMRSFAVKGFLERQWLGRFDLVVLSSSKEVEKASKVIGSSENLTVWPNVGTAPSAGFERSANAELTLFFVGHLGYPPNQDGLLWFSECILPLILERRPGAILRVAGRHCPDSLTRRLALPGVELLGYEADLEPLYASSSAAIIPLRAGTGTRIKILEAFAHLCPVVSTRKGAEGLKVEGGRELLLADDPESFAASCLSLFGDEELQRGLTERGQRFWEAEHSQDSLNQVIANSVETLHECASGLK